MKGAAAGLAVLVFLMLALPSKARADLIKIGVYSQKEGPTRAAVGAAIHVASAHSGHAGKTVRAAAVARSPAVRAPEAARVSGEVTNSYPTIASNSTLLRNPTPAGPNSFWYQVGQRQACIYVPNTSPPCYTLVAGPPGGRARALAVNPAAIAASIADRLALAPGQLEASPSASGLTGVASWFWLDPAPQTMTLSVSLGGESVTVTAEPAVSWRFGDGAGFAGGAGVPYRAGPPPPEAVTHLYETRCLPGDRGRNPYVLGSCGQDGYRLEALVTWRISYDGDGPVTASGSLPTRTTESSIAYPVSEARAFLGGGASQ